MRLAELRALLMDNTEEALPAVVALLRMNGKFAEADSLAGLSEPLARYYHAQAYISELELLVKE